ncbi:MAG: exodeoxyribonuclease VII large subunit [Candidatus Bipolaricaulota bacterium]|nr:exodeoxyribonuclease VII large subunit [Candidatus Bipolaricaulota bacterium]MDW8126881.1 exodeoxyribonuclease VII large subunit [Candidatus Bipolaricaulota bacterium]
MRKVECSGESILIQFDYDARLVQLVRALPESRFDQKQRLWRVPKAHVVSVVELLQNEGFAFDAAIQNLYREKKAQSQDLTVSALNARVRAVLTEAFPQPVWVVGEILGYEKNAHKERVEFHLVERREGRIIAQVEAILFPEARDLIEGKLAQAGYPFRLQDEITVRVLAEVDLWVREGLYRLVIRDLDIHYTLGEAARRREEILRKLAKEGILERNRSLPFPLLPLRVGLITSLGSDAQNDVLNTLKASGFAFQVLVHGARMQGHFTEPSVLNALDWFRAHAEEFDVILICRGGGSRADLAWFDSEALARAVALFPLPVVVGIGHEEDRCVLDEVGWRPKPATPSGAAKLLVQKIQETLRRVEENFTAILTNANTIVEKATRTVTDKERLLTRITQEKLAWERRELSHRERRLVQATQNRLRLAREYLRRVGQVLPQAVGRTLGGQHARAQEAQRRLLRGSRRELSLARAELERRVIRLEQAIQRKLAQEQERLAGRAKRLQALDPKRVVERGFAILRLPFGRVVTDPDQAPAGTVLTAELRAGILRLLSQGGEREGRN